MVRTSARLLKVLSLLQSRRFWTGGELSRALGVTERSVRRDVDRLRSLGYPIHAASGVGGGYQLGAGKELPPLPLEDDEAVAVAVGLRAAAAGPVRGVEEASVRALAKLEQVLPKRLRRRVKALHEVSIQLDDTRPGVDAEVLTLLANACRDATVVRFEYQSRDGAASTRTVEPYRLVHTSLRWYVLAYDLGREDWRTFRVDRIASRPVAGRRFQVRPLPSEDVAAYVSKAVSTEPYPYRAKVTIHAPAVEVLRRFSRLAVHVEPRGEKKCLVQTGAGRLEGIALYLALLGYELEVHEPKELVDLMQSLSERLARAAARSGGRGSRTRLDSARRARVRGRRENEMAR